MAEENSIRCMQLPLHDLHLLLPNSAVAEIIGYTEPEPAHRSEGWFDGRISWRGVMVPVISFEKLCNLPAVEPGPRSRVAIIYNHTSQNDSIPYIGIILQDIPRAYLAEKERMLGGMEKTDCEFVSCRADPMLDDLVIPDLDAVLLSLQQRLDN